MDTSGFPLPNPGKYHAGHGGHRGAMVVVPRIWAICVTSDAAAPLKPYQQNQRIKQPRAPKVSGVARNGVDLIFPFFSLLYLPSRGPSIQAPSRATGRPPYE